LCFLENRYSPILLSSKPGSAWGNPHLLKVLILPAHKTTQNWRGENSAEHTIVSGCGGGEKSILSRTARQHVSGDRSILINTARTSPDGNIPSVAGNIGVSTLGNGENSTLSRPVSGNIPSVAGNTEKTITVSTTDARKRRRESNTLEP
jgi:hypothetical protein